MINLNKYHKEITSLHRLKNEGGLDSVRRQALQARIIKQVNSGTKGAVVAPALRERSFMFSRYGIIAGAILVLTAGTAAASSGAKAGDPLFGVKRAEEKALVALSLSDQSKAELQARIAEKRLDDVNKVSDDHRSEARTEAHVQLSTALEVLARVRADLVVKGNTQAVAALDATIARLTERASTENLKVELEIEDGKLEVDIEDEGDDDNDDVDNHSDRDGYDSDNDNSDDNEQDNDDDDNDGDRSDNSGPNNSSVDSSGNVNVNLDLNSGSNSSSGSDSISDDDSDDDDDDEDRDDNSGSGSSGSDQD